MKKMPFELVRSRLPAFECILIGRILAEVAGDKRGKTLEGF